MKALFVILLFPALLLAAQGGAIKDKTTTGVVKIPAGTTIFPQYNLPNKSIGTIEAEITCDPTFDLSILIRESYDSGKTWSCPQTGPCRGWSMSAGPCVDKLGNPRSVAAAKFES